MAISDLLDAKLEPIETKVDKLANKVTNIELTLENEIRPNIQLLAENYVPAAKRYEKASDQIESMQADIDVLKKVVTGHSEILQKIS